MTVLNKNSSTILNGMVSGAGAGAAFGPIGLGVGALAGATMAAFTASEMNKNRIQQEQLEKETMMKNRDIMYSDLSKSIYNTYPNQGVKGAMMYGKYGGKILAAGGILSKGLTAGQVVGDSHGVDSDGDGRNGVPVMDANGNQQAELEKGEIVYVDSQGNKRVLSSRLGVAQEAKKLMNTPEYIKEEGLFTKLVANIHKQLESSKDDKYKLNTLNERLRGIKHPLDGLYAQQEEIKKANGIPETETVSQEQPKMMASGGMLESGNPLLRRITPFISDENSPEYFVEQQDPRLEMKGVTNFETPQMSDYKPEAVGFVENGLKSLGPAKITADASNPYKLGLSTIGNALSFADNVGNAMINADRPPVPTPVQYRALPLKTKVNVDPLLTENRNRLSNLYTNLDNTIGNTQITTANKLAAFSNTIKQNNQIQMDKINRETELENRNTANIQSVKNANIDKENQYNFNKMSAADDKLLADSANLANASTKLQMLIRQENLKELDKKKLALIAAKYKSTGVLTRTEDKYIDELLKSIEQ